MSQTTWKVHRNQSNLGAGARQRWSAVRRHTSRAGEPASVRPEKAKSWVGTAEPL